MSGTDQSAGAEGHLRFDEPKFDGDAGMDRKPSGPDHKGSIYAKPDLENGEEYANLVAYISSHYEGPRRKSVVSMEEQDAAKKKQPKWKFWKRKSATDGDDAFEVPDDVDLTPSSPCTDHGIVAGSRHQTGYLAARGRVTKKAHRFQRACQSHPLSVRPWLTQVLLDHRKRKHVPQGWSRLSS